MIDRILKLMKEENREHGRIMVHINNQIRRKIREAEEQELKDKCI